MAKVLIGDGNDVKGKLGEVVYVRHKNGTYVRRAPRVRKEAHTKAMLLNQQRFVCLNRFCSQFKRTLIPQIWNDAAIINYGYSFFMKANSPAFAKDGSIAEPLLLKFSVGELLMPQTLIAQRIAPESNIIQVSWEKESHIPGFHLIDELMVISYDGEKFSPMTPTGLVRKDLQGAFELPVMPLETGFVYLFFRSDDRRSFSVSKSFKI